MDNNYALYKLNSAIAADAKKVYIAFQEPIDSSSINKTNFTIPGVVVNSVSLLTRSSADLGAVGGNDYSLVVVDTDTDLTVGGPRTLTVSGVKDLAGNSMKAGINDTVTF